MSYSEARLSMKLLFFGIIFLIALPKASAVSDYFVGLSFGLGGTGLTGRAPTEDGLVGVARSEGPGIVALYADKLISDRLSLGLEHVRGFRLAPATSGVAFTGIAGRYYFGSAPSGVETRTRDGGATLFLQRYSFFAGGAAGIANGTVERDTDQITTISGSGFYIGFRGGTDYILTSRVLVRSELTASTTLFSGGANAIRLTEFSIRCGFLFFL